MLYSYNQCIKRYGSDKKLKQEIENGQIFKIEKGIYSDVKHVSELSIISMKYSNCVFTLNSALYYHGLTDVIPNFYYLATRNKKRISDVRVKQIYENSAGFYLGCISIKYNNTSIKIYNKERMLVELIRNKNKLPFDYYKEVIINYRRIIEELDIPLIQEYASTLPKTNMIMEALEMEVL